MRREQLGSAGRAIYNDRGLRAFWTFFVIVVVLVWVFG